MVTGTTTMRVTPTGWRALIKDEISTLYEKKTVFLLIKGSHILSLYFNDEHRYSEIIHFI
jgi:hypothetical protein